MKPSNQTTCPPTDTLDAFAKGKLQPPQLDVCESHISDCPNCLETLRGLGADDTLTGHVAAAMAEASDANHSAELASLLDRMLAQPPGVLAPANTSRKRPLTSLGIPAELLADRAAEVLRCLDIAGDGSLGSIGDYDLERLIGAGSSGVVFKAIDRTLNRAVALKVLRPSLGEMARQRFISEAQSAASIEHNNVVTIYQVGESERLAFMAMQWIPGETLEQQLASGKQFEEHEVRRIASQIAAGLQAAHAKQIIHRDIKPANIWRTENNQTVKILDFGLARISDDDPGLTATGMLAGTPNFMSPEQTKGLELDGRSDLFSLGCLMYRLLTGRLPFGAPTVLATLQSIQTHHPNSVQSLQPSASDDMTDLTMALLEKQPNNRPASAEQLVELLENDRDSWPMRINRYSASSVNETQPIVSPAPIALSSSHRFLRWITAAIAAGLLGFGGYFFGPQIIRIATDQGEIVIETDDPDVQIQLKDGKSVRVVDTKTDQSSNIRSGVYELSAAPSDSDAEVTFDITPNRLVMKRGGKQVVKVTKTTKALDSSSSDGNQKDSIASNALVYDGKGFDEWIQIAKTDRYPRNVADAIKACGALAELPGEQKALFDIIQSAARRHGNNVISGGDNDDEYVMKAMLQAIWQQPTELAAKFVEEQLNTGNSRSRMFCAWILNGGIEIVAPNVQDLNEILAARINTLLPLALEKGKLAENIIIAALKVPHNKLVKLNPELESFASRTYWEMQDSKNEYLKQQLAYLVAHTKSKDQKIVLDLIGRYEKVKWKPTPTSNNAFRALTFQNAVAFSYPPTAKPITDWHDEVRADFFTRVLEQELSTAAVQARSYSSRRKIQGGGGGLAATSLLQVIYEAQQCLDGIIPSLPKKIREGIKLRLQKIDEAFPKEIESYSVPIASPAIDDGRANDTRHNLKALIATCDDPSTSQFIEIPKAKGSRYPSQNMGLGGGGFGGGGLGGGGVF